MHCNGDAQQTAAFGRASLRALDHASFGDVNRSGREGSCAPISFNNDPALNKGVRTVRVASASVGELPECFGQFGAQLKVPVMTLVKKDGMIVAKAESQLVAQYVVHGRFPAEGGRGCHPRPLEPAYSTSELSTWN
uniref:Uncharacterized protein n=1 Tax=Aquisalinus luteolus TaxID=1566827 RepID=A0A8J3A596_9PROT|nr:hypothetical protein GCM10011355_09200 [Aquisalinus luteolus]